MQKAKNAVRYASNQNQQVKTMSHKAEEALDSMIKFVAILEKKDQDRQFALEKFLSKWDSLYNRKHGIALPVDQLARLSIKTTDNN